MSTPLRGVGRCVPGRTLAANSGRQQMAAGYLPEEVNLVLLLGTGLAALYYSYECYN